MSEESEGTGSGENPYDPAREVGARPVPGRRRKVLVWVAASGLVLTVALVSVLAVMVDRAREAAARSSCNLGGIALSFHNYQDQHGKLPPAVVRDADGNPLYSWRVLILPYLECGELYEEFHLDEPWDSEHNIRLLERMPTSYEAPWSRYVDVPPHHTVCRVISGPGTLFDERCEVRLPEDVPDGLSKTILFVEAGDPVPWTKPDETTYDPTQPIQLRGLFRNGYRACSADTRYRFVEHDMDPSILHALITRDGGEKVSVGW